VDSIDAQALFVSSTPRASATDEFAVRQRLVLRDDTGAQWQKPRHPLLLWKVAILSPPAVLAVRNKAFMSAT